MYIDWMDVLLKACWTMLGISVALVVVGLATNELGPLVAALAVALVSMAIAGTQYLRIGRRIKKAEGAR